jgi:hypothetical protein
MNQPFMGLYIIRVVNESTVYGLAQKNNLFTFVYIANKPSSNLIMCL